MKWCLLLLLALVFAAPAARAQLPEGDVHGYVYVDVFELRKEFAIRLRAFPEWTNDVPPGGSLDEADQAKILTQLSGILAESCPMEIDSNPADPTLDLIRFVRIEPEFGVVADERESIPVQEAQVAAIFGMPLSGYPDEISIRWNLFGTGTEEVPVTFVSEAGKSTFFLSKENPNQKWLVQKDQEAGQLTPVPDLEVDPPAAPLKIPFFTLLFGALAILCGLGGRLLRGTAKMGTAVAAGLFLVLSLTTWGLAGFPVKEDQPGAEPVPPDQAEEVVHALLRNIYTSFDYREESLIYDTLAKSVSGPLLETIYLDIRRGLELEEQGGPRVKINHIDLRNLEVEAPEGGPELRADAEWVAVGDVSHWGHLHTRLNKYHAWLSLEPVDGTWKLVDLEIIEEGRL